MVLDDARVRRLRASIPALRQQIYVNWGGSGPSPEAVLREVNRTLRRESSLGPFHPTLLAEARAGAHALRISLAALSGARADEIGLVDNTTAGVNIAAAGIEWKKGDQVLVTDLEHPGGYLPWLLWRDRRGIQVKLLRAGGSDEELLSNLDAALSPRTRAVCASHVAWLTGRRLPLGAMGNMCRRAGALFVVDGAQSVGQIAVDMRRCRADVYTVSGQKWLMGPQGTGAVYVRTAVRQRVREATAGYRSARKKALETLTYLPRSDAARFEVSTNSPALVAGLSTAVSICLKSGPAAIEKRIAQLAGRLLSFLRDTEGVEVLSPPGPAQSGLVSFRIGGREAEEAVDSLLRKHRVVLRSVESVPPALRASIHYLNTHEEMEHIGRAVESLARTSGKRRRGR